MGFFDLLHSSGTDHIARLITSIAYSILLAGSEILLLLMFTHRIAIKLNYSKSSDTLNRGIYSCFFRYNPCRHIQLYWIRRS
jgi:hypothetical protein